MDWYDRAEQELVDALNNGEISNKEFHREMRDLNAKLRQQAEDAAAEAYDDVMQGW